ncbi:MAG TPA: preprotein translocase subunit SecG [Candidatus Paceibacterota bacterium]
MFSLFNYVIIVPMQLVANILPYIEIILSVVLVLAIMLQQSGAGVGGALGSGDGSSFHHTRRGFEKFLFYLSIICAILFALSAVLSILLKARI